jgi:hypothetical protein
VVPEKKVTAATLAAAVTTIVIWILRSFDVEVPAEVALAISTVVVAIAGYLAPHTHRPDLAAKPGAPAEGGATP